MAKQPSSYDPSSFDPLTAAQAANAFLIHSQAFVESLPTDPRQTDASASLGEVVASATCLSLSVELFLKSLLILNDCPVPRTHDLLVLYDALTPSTQDAVGKRFDFWAAAEDGTAATVRLVYTHGDDAPASSDNSADQAADNSIRTVLERSRDAFLAWRYLHEITGGEVSDVMDYNYFHLTAVARALSDCCHGIMFGPQPQPGGHS